METLLVTLKPILVTLCIHMAFKAFMKWTETSPDVKPSGQHYWGENEKTHNVVKKCPQCNGIFHGAEFEICEKCNLELVST